MDKLHVCSLELPQILQSKGKCPQAHILWCTWCVSVCIHIPGKRPIRHCKACCLVQSFCCWLRRGCGVVGRLPPGHTASWMTCRYATQYLVHIRLATLTSNHLEQPNTQQCLHLNVFTGSTNKSLANLN